MTEQEYRQHPAMSRSQLWKMSESPEKFKYSMKHPDEPTPALVFGQLFHAIVLQPETVWEQFATMPNVDKRTKAGKEEYQKFVEESQNKTVVSVDMVQQATEMCEALYSNEFVKKLLTGKGENEVALFWEDDMTKESCKCRLDRLKELGDKLLVIDLKTTENAENEAFMRSAIKYGYDFQSAMYSEGVKANKGKTPIFIFVAVEKKPPYAVNILQADELFVKRGYDLFREYIGTFHDCKTTGKWWGYLGKYNQINSLALPSYLAKEIE